LGGRSCRRGRRLIGRNRTLGQVNPQSGNPPKSDVEIGGSEVASFVLGSVRFRHFLVRCRPQLAVYSQRDYEDDIGQ
jgi:hypothetical protein